jgi:surface protein
VLPTYLKAEVLRIQRDVLPRLRAEAKAKLDRTNDWMMENFQGPFEPEELVRVQTAKQNLPQREDYLPGRPKIRKTLRNLDEWDVWDVLSRRNGMPELKNLGLLATATLGTDSDDKIYYNMPENERLYVSNQIVMTMLAHIWGVEMWAKRHMVVFQPVAMYPFNDENGKIAPHGGEDYLNIYGPIEAWDVSLLTKLPKFSTRGDGVMIIDYYNGEDGLPDADFDRIVDLNLPIGAWDVKHITNMSELFYDNEYFDQPIGEWKVDNVTDMRQMFAYTKAFNQPIGKWNVSKVRNMIFMFDEAEVFNQPIENWVVSSVTDMKGMFAGATAFNQPIGRWNVSNVTDMSLMFKGAEDFNQPLGSFNAKGRRTDSKGWNVSNVTDMGFMFAGATAFNQPIGGWNVSNVTDISDMFRGATSMQREYVPWYNGQFEEEEEKDEEEEEDEEEEA